MDVKIRHKLIEIEDRVSDRFVILITRMMFIKHYAPNRCLCIKVAKSTMFN